MSRAGGARLPAMERQALRDAVVRHNAKGSPSSTTYRDGCPGGLIRWKRQFARAVILRGPEHTVDGCCAWTRVDFADGWRPNTVDPATIRA
jgi:hypothetical protein